MSKKEPLQFSNLKHSCTPKIIISPSKKERKAIKEFNDDLLNVVKIIEKIWSVNEQQVIEIDKLYYEIWRFDEVIENFENVLAKNNANARTLFLESIETAKISELKEELEYKQDLIIQVKSETNEIFSDLYSKRGKAIYQLDLKGEKFTKLKVSKTEIHTVKESNNLGQSYWWRN